MRLPTPLHGLLTAMAVAFFAGFFASTSPPAQANNGADLLCCENDNGTYHPVSPNGNAANHCVQTWEIPDGEPPGQYCELGPPVLTPEEICWARDSGTCSDDTGSDEFSCTFGFNPDTGSLGCIVVYTDP